MEKTAMQKILEAEKRADEIIAEGVSKARKISEESAAEIKKMTTDFENDLEKKTSDIIEAGVGEASGEIRKLELQYIKECEEIKNNASSNIDDAVAFVVENMGDGKWQ